MATTLQRGPAVTFSEPVKFAAAVFVPPVGVYLEDGIDEHLGIDVVLTFFGFFPGIAHALPSS